MNIGRALVAMAATVGAAACVAQAGPVYTFNRITNNGQDVGSQLTVEILNTGEGGVGAGQVGFLFRNSGPTASSITDVYFDDGTLLGIATITSGSGVSFSQGASPPNLPGGNAINFQTSAGFLADSNPPVQPNGVNPGEWLQITFNLINGQTFADTIASLEWALANPNNSSSQGLRIGLHIQGLPNGQSDSYVNGPIIPLPSAVAMGSAGLLLVARRRRRETL